MLLNNNEKNEVCGLLMKKYNIVDSSQRFDVIWVSNELIWSYQICVLSITGSKKQLIIERNK